MRIVFFSDTHGHHKKIDIPEGDILICGGDFTDKGSIMETVKFMKWFNQQPHTHKILISGNHDICLDYRRNTPYYLVQRTFEDYLADSEFNHYLLNTGCTIDGVNFWGSPYTPKYDTRWAFEMERGEELHKNWAKISADTNVLITHGPPALILDLYNNAGKKIGIGDGDLRYHVERIKPSLHLFGHVHDSRGFLVESNTTFINGSIKNDNNNYDLNSAFVIDYEPEKLVIFDDVSLIPNTP